MSVNTICRCAFGIEANAYKDPDQDLVKYGDKVFEGFRATNWGITFLAHLINYVPSLESKIPPWTEAFDKMYNLAKSVIKQRTELGIKTNDFLSHLIELKKNIAADSSDLAKIMSDDIIYAQGVIFFAAGHETTMNALSTLSYNLAKHPQVQEKLYDEVLEVLNANNGRLDHETIGDMAYLDAVINENLRLNGPATNHFRNCNKDTEVCYIFLKKTVPNKNNMCFVNFYRLLLASSSRKA